MMTCSPLAHLEDLKPLLRTTTHLVSPEEDVEDEYSSLLFGLAPGEQGGGSYLLLGLSPSSHPHMRMRDKILSQPDVAQDSTTGPQPWHPLRFWPTPTSQR